MVIFSGQAAEDSEIAWCVVEEFVSLSELWLKAFFLRDVSVDDDCLVVKQRHFTHGHLDDLALIFF
ncbi:hypothetical protein D9M69_703840 [compost metagenome]